MEMIGKKENAWANPANGGKKANSLTVRDVVDCVLKIPAFGFDGYNPKASVRDLIPTETHRQPKSKRITFAEESQKAHSYVPGAGKYHTAHDWAKAPSTRTAKFFVTKRRTQADDIAHANQFKEKSSPSCNLYDNAAAWKYTKGKIKGTQTNNDARVTFVQESGWKAVQSPGNKFTTVDPVSINHVSLIYVFQYKFKAKSPPRPMIRNGETRFHYTQKAEKSDVPGPTSYNS